VNAQSDHVPFEEHHKNALEGILSFGYYNYAMVPYDDREKAHTCLEPRLLTYLVKIHAGISAVGYWKNQTRTHQEMR